MDNHRVGDFAAVQQYLGRGVIWNLKWSQQFCWSCNQANEAFEPNTCVTALSILVTNGSYGMIRCTEGPITPGNKHSYRVVLSFRRAIFNSISPSLKSELKAMKLETMGYTLILLIMQSNLVTIN